MRCDRYGRLGFFPATRAAVFVMPRLECSSRTFDRVTVRYALAVRCLDLASNALLCAAPSINSTAGTVECEYES
jgi:hypothetical protein